MACCLFSLPLLMQETTEDRAARAIEGFPEVEKDLHDHTNSRKHISHRDNLSSFLGKKNPVARKVNPVKDTVWLLDNTAYIPENKVSQQPPQWQAEFVAAYFVRNGTHTSKDLSKWVGRIAHITGIGSQAREDRLRAEATIARRLQPFLATLQPARSVQISLPRSGIKKLGPGGRNALSSDLISELHDHGDGSQIEITAIHPELVPHGKMITHFAGPEGWTIVSDIDDTIKITSTPSPIGVLRSTFVNEPTAIDGMPELYAHIHSTLSPTWFYLSASPYNLYTFLRPFLHEHYPRGTMLLRDASWNVCGFLQGLTEGTRAYKTNRIEKIYSWLPRRKIICIGDSTQTDPEVFADMYRKYDGWIKAIFIRLVTDVHDMKHTDKNEPARFEKAFVGVPKDVWKVFKDPRELHEVIGNLKDWHFDAVSV